MKTAAVFYIKKSVKTFILTLLSWTVTFEMSAGRTNGIIAAAPVTAVSTVPLVIIFIIELKNVTASRTNRAV